MQVPDGIVEIYGDANSSGLVTGNIERGRIYYVSSAIKFADGTNIEGTIDNTSALREVGNALTSMNLVKAAKKFWTVLIKDTANTVQRVQ